MDLSIIIPIYNVKDYLARCLDSVVSQKDSIDMEIICIDDGSTDGSQVICDDYAAMHEQIKVIHKHNSGYGHSVNIGIGKAIGDYIGIVEPDDYIEEDMYSVLLQIARKTEADIVKSNYYSFYTDGEKEMNSQSDLFHNLDLYNKVIIPREYDECFAGACANWTGIYKRKFLQENQIWHNETAGASFQDQGFFVQAMMLSNRMIVSDKAFYHYRIDNPSSSIVSDKKAFCILDEVHFIWDKLTKSGLDEEKWKRRYFKYKYARLWINIDRVDEYEIEKYENYIVKEYWEDNQEPAFSDEFIWPFYFFGQVRLRGILGKEYKKIILHKNKIEEIFKLLGSIVIFGLDIFYKRILENVSEKSNIKIVEFISKRDQMSEEEIEEITNLIAEKSKDHTVILCWSLMISKIIAERIEKKGIKNYILSGLFI